MYKNPQFVRVKGYKMKRRKKKEKIEIFVAISRIDGNKIQRKKKNKVKNF